MNLELDIYKWTYGRTEESTCFSLRENSSAVAFDASILSAGTLLLGPNLQEEIISASTERKCLKALKLLYTTRAIGEQNEIAIQIFLERCMKQSISLSFGSSLVYLSLNEFGLTDDLAKILAEMLGENCSLVYLSLRQNVINNEGASAIAQALSKNERLLTLDLSMNSLSDDAAVSLSHALDDNISLRHLNLSMNLISNSGFNRLKKSALNSKSIIWMPLFNNNIRPNDKVVRLANLLQHREKEFHLKRQVQQKKLYDDAFSQGVKTAWKRSKLMLVGQGRAGKSSTIRSLLGKEFVSDWNSTTMAEIIETRVESAKSNEKKRDMKIKNSKAWIERDLKESNGFASDFATEFVASQIEKLTNRRDKNAKEKKQRTFRKSRKSLYMKTFKKKKNKNKKKKLSEVSDDLEKMGANEAVEEEVELANSVEEDHIESYGYDEQLVNRRLRKGIDPDSIVNFSIWDLGGQEVFYSLHHLFLTKTGVYILVFDMRELLDDQNGRRQNALQYLLYWLRSIKLHAPAAPLILVGTFCASLEQKHVPEINKDLKEIGAGSDIFPQVVTNNDDNLLYFPIDNKECNGIEKLRFALENAARTDGSVYEEVSIRWISLLDKLHSESSERSYLSLSDDVKPLALNLGITSNEELDLALGLFRERGLIIHMTTTEILKDIVVIKPQWLINALGKVIRDGNLHVDEKKFKSVGLQDDLKRINISGLASRDFLEFVWKREKVDFFLDLMKHTMLLSEWKFTTEEYYLVPSLLQENFEPEKSNNRLRLVLDFDCENSFLPKGVFHRLICLCVAHSGSAKTNKGHDISSPKLFKNFASIEFEKNFFLDLLENKGAQTITVFVRDMSRAAQSLLILQSMIRKVNYDVMGAGLQWETKLECSENGVKDFYSLAEARERDLAPWFNNGNSTKTAKNEFVDNFSSFLDNL